MGGPNLTCLARRWGTYQIGLCPAPLSCSQSCVTLESNVAVSGTLRLLLFREELVRVEYGGEWLSVTTNPPSSPPKFSHCITQLCDSAECWTSLDLRLSCPRAKLRVYILDAAAPMIENHCSEHAGTPDCSKWPQGLLCSQQTGVNVLGPLCACCHLPRNCCPGVFVE